MRLRLDHSDTRLPEGLDNLTSLEELTGVSVHYDDDPTLFVKELGHLTGLRVLELSWSAENFGEALVQSLGNLRKLQSLDIRIFSGRGNLMRGWAPPPCLRRFLCLGTNGELPTLSAWIKNSSSSLLTFVDVLIRQVCPEDLHVLGALPSLRIVRLWSEGRHSVAGMKVKAGTFPCARMCAFMHFATAPSMFAPGAMPRVQHLRFTIWAWDFGGFGLDDLRMGHLPSLEEVVVGIWCRQEKEEEDMAVVERVEAALRQAAEDHPNRLALDVSRKISPSYYHQWRI
ncbi:hypothetical protein QOZ80_1BG0052340 [Eleusine coracana subsp. coracana]|nr:hypothetical protein QOZ80_1BG0052340 [Eleusine coracana subsp. coracana]